MALVPRAIIGNIGGGKFGLKVSLPGIDALATSGESGEHFSFHSEWTNVVELAQFGIATWPNTVNFTSLGYIPIIEVRQVDVGPSQKVYYDDQSIFVSSPSRYGPRFLPRISASQILPYEESGWGYTPSPRAHPNSFSGNYIYAIYKGLL